jgi:hypothetical protein
MNYWTSSPTSGKTEREQVIMPIPVIIGLGLITLGFGLAVYIVVASIRDRRQVRPLNNDEE